MRLTVGISQRLAQYDSGAIMRFYTECNLASRCQHLRHGLEHRRQVVEIHKNVGGEYDVITRFDLGLTGKEPDNLGFNQPIVQAFRACPRKHRRREIDAHNPIAAWTEWKRREPGAATEIKH